MIVSFVYGDPSCSLRGMVVVDRGGREGTREDQIVRLVSAMGIQISPLGTSKMATPMVGSHLQLNELL